MISAIDCMIGQRFFYADEETGIGWESRIEEITQSYESMAIHIHLSCGTRVKVPRGEVLRGNSRLLVTNMREDYAI